MSKMDKLKKDYEDIDIPEELDSIVKASIQEAKRKRIKKRPVFRNSFIGVAAAAAIFIGSINVSPAFAKSMVNVPILGSIVEVFTVQQLTVDEGTYQADVSTPGITGLEDEELQAALNEKYAVENKELFEKFEKEIAELKEAGGGHLGVDAGYEVLTDNDRILSIMRYQVNTVGSSSTTMSYDTIDKIDNVLITLPSLFKDDSYIEAINTYIAGEMERQMAEDEMISYFINDEYAKGFTTIKPDQNFYITDDQKLVLSFDKYEVAPGYMGVVTFEIPTDIVKDLLVSDVYIR
ncbi:anti-sigma-V factor rsiV [Sporosarcina koreensis]|uniref:anti-sigma-V factor rsiV n=1 Tax=Sporosarcina koreensis TaxID=334735 RepID=UPI000753A652|nr:anti-sigma-V factor rsiV [Sporosarcina koreensis]